MYTANGVQREFPAPAEFSGFVVLSPPGGGGFLMKEDQAYTVRDKTVFFYAAPPTGWTVRFDTEGVEAMAGVYTVIYPDGSMKTAPRDPWELLIEAQGVLKDAKAVRDGINADAESAKTEIKAGAREILDAQDKRADSDRKAFLKDIKNAAEKTEAEITERFADRLGEITKAAEDARTIGKNAAEIVLSAKSYMERIADECRGAINQAPADLAASAAAAKQEMSEMLEAMKALAESIPDVAFKAHDGIIGAADEKIKAFRQDLADARTSVEAMFDDFAARHPALRQGERGNIVRTRIEGGND